MEEVVELAAMEGVVDKLAMEEVDDQPKWKM